MSQSKGLFLSTFIEPIRKLNVVALNYLHNIKTIIFGSPLKSCAIFHDAVVLTIRPLCMKNLSIQICKTTLIPLNSQDSPQGLFLEKEDNSVKKSNI